MELTTADKLLNTSPASQNTIDQTLDSHKKKKNQLHFSYADYKFTIDTLLDEMLSPIEWCTIWTMKDSLQVNKKFLGQASIYAKLSKAKNWQKLLNIKAFTPGTYAILKENIETFYDIEAIKNLQ